MGKRVYVLDGAKFSSLPEFFQYFGEVVLPDADWGVQGPGGNESEDGVELQLL
jgi:hypothetical protein